MISIGLLVTIVFLSIGAVVIGDIGRRDYERAENAAQNVLVTLEAEISRNFELYDLSLQGVVEGLKFPEIASVPPALRQQILFDRAATAKYLGSIFVLDKTGDLILDSRTATPPASNHAGREYFQAAARNSNGQMYLSRPWSTPEGDHLIAISRRISAPDGSLRGVVVGTMRLSYFYGLFENVKLHPRDKLTLVRADGTVIMRAPFDYAEIGSDLSAAATFQKMTKDSAGVFEQQGQIDNVARLHAFRHVGNSPLIVSYGQALDFVYAGWWQEASRLGGIILLVSIANIGLIAFLARALRRGSFAEHGLAIAAMTDGLTGLCNRRRFDEIFEQTWRTAQHDGGPVAVMMIDADHFKLYNDRFGHQAGDQALIAISQCIRQSARRGRDVAARYGGEEFIVVLSDASPEQAIEVGEKIRALVLAQREAQHGRPDAMPTVSIGIAATAAAPGLSREDLVSAADAALYKAKNNGRNRVELSSQLHVVRVAETRAAA